jgi:hypothetical protein
MLGMVNRMIEGRERRFFLRENVAAVVEEICTAGPLSAQMTACILIVSRLGRDRDRPLDPTIVVAACLWARTEVVSIIWMSPSSAAVTASIIPFHTPALRHRKNDCSRW